MHFLRPRLDGPVNEWGTGEEGGVGGGGDLKEAAATMKPEDHLWVMQINFS